VNGDPQGKHVSWKEAVHFVARKNLRYNIPGMNGLLPSIARIEEHVVIV
jgi:hypothetical protein